MMVVFEAKIHLSSFNKSSQLFQLTCLIVLYGKNGIANFCGTLVNDVNFVSTRPEHAKPNVEICPILGINITV